ncbi:jouberin-like isoform X2 [Macrobrachium rosenbergii]|uniref:jouberin-like isoform X2 n=1 Tax=Macrobrachium rosenbergii TaxID=79674 RepID=UPI0034D5CFB6
MTLEELEPLAEKAEIGIRNPSKGSNSKGSKGTGDQNKSDALSSLMTAALQKHVAKKKQKKKLKSPKCKDIQEEEDGQISESEIAATESLERNDKERVTERNDKERVTERNDEESVTEAVKAGAALGITLHGCDRLGASPVIFPHPVVQVHICNADSGKWLQKSSKDRKVTSYYESSEVDYILPIMTQPFDMKKNRSICCQWEEQLIFNEPLSHFLSDKPQVLIFFQLMDFSSVSASSEITETQSCNLLSRGWVTLAWAFLKIKGSNNHINIGERLRLQLWKPRKSTGVTLMELYSWWKSGSRTKYPSSLLVSLQEIIIPQNPHPSLRSMLVTQQEYGRESSPENIHSDHLEGESYNSPEIIPKGSIQWSRKPSQSFQIPNLVKHCLPHADDGCMVVKFSHSGLRLACGAQRRILIYNVLSGKLEHVFEGHLGLIYDLCWNDEDQLLLSASGDSTVRVWDVEPEEICGNSQILTHPSHVYVAKFFPFQPQLLVTGCYDHMIRVWYCGSSGRYLIIQEITNHLSFVNALCFKPEGDVLYSGDKQGVIFVWNVKINKKVLSRRKTSVLSLQQEVKIVDIVGKVINSISYHPAGYRLVVHTRDGQIRLINHKHWTVTHRLSGFLNVREQIRGCVSPCGTWIVSGSEDHGVYVWHSDSGELTAAFLNMPIKRTISCVDFHPLDHMLAVSSYHCKTPVLVLVYNQVKSQQSDILFNSVQANKLSGLSSLFTDSQNLSHIDSESSDSASNNETEEGVPNISSTGQSHNLISPNPSSSKLNDRNKMAMKVFADGKQMWEDVGSKILQNLDSVLKIASEDPLSVNNMTISHEREDLRPLGRLVSVLHDFEAREPDELSVKQGDYVMFVKKESHDWWQVRTADMKQTGLVPSNYLKILPLQDEQENSDSEKVVAVHSTSGEVNFFVDKDDKPSKARLRRYRARTDSYNRTLPN